MNRVPLCWHVLNNVTNLHDQRVRFVLSENAPNVHALRIFQDLDDVRHRDMASVLVLLCFDGEVFVMDGRQLGRVNSVSPDDVDTNFCTNMPSK